MNLRRVVPLVCVVFWLAAGPLPAAGPFGTPQPTVRGDGGLHTAFGYWLQEDRFGDAAPLVRRQHQLYSELGYGVRERWEVNARVGITDLRLSDPFASSAAATVTARDDYRDRSKLFATVAAKLFRPLGDTLGIGATVQGSYHFGDFTDSVSGTAGGVPFTAELRLQDFWEIELGAGLQCNVPGGVKLYAGPHLHHAQFRIRPSVAVPGIGRTAEVSNETGRTALGGFAGLEAPLAKGFRLGVEGRYRERLSFGAALLYLY